MDRIHKLPFILGASMSIIVGVISHYSNVEVKDTYVRMIAAMVIFFIIGFIARNIFLNVKQEVDEKIEEEELERLQIEAEEKINAKKDKEDSDKGQNIDIKSVGDKDAFMTESLTKAVSSKLDEK